MDNGDYQFDDSKDLQMTPDLVKPRRLGTMIIIFIDQLGNTPSHYWTDKVRSLVSQWVRRTNFQGQSSIWFWGCHEISPVNGKIAWAEHIAYGGLGKGFSDFLLNNLKNLWGDAVSLRDPSHHLPPKDWNILCHIENGQVYLQIDPITWQMVE